MLKTVELSGSKHTSKRNLQSAVNESLLDSLASPARGRFGLIDWAYNLAWLDLPTENTLHTHRGLEQAKEGGRHNGQ